jgi:hypothetical protein
MCPQAEELKRHCAEYLDLFHATLPNTREVVPSVDPRLVNHGARWRDTLRCQLGFEKLMVEFSVMSFMNGDERIRILGLGENYI